MLLSSTSTPPSAEVLRWRLFSFLFSSFLWWDLSFLAICCGGLMANESSSSALCGCKEKNSDSKESATSCFITFLKPWHTYVGVFCAVDMFFLFCKWATTAFLCTPLCCIMTINDPWILKYYMYTISAIKVHMFYSYSSKYLSSVDSSRVYGELRIVISIFWSRSSPSSGVSRLASRSSDCGTGICVNCARHSYKLGILQVSIVYWMNCISYNCLINTFIKKCPHLPGYLACS